MNGSTAASICFMIMWFCAGLIVLVGGIVFIVTGSMMEVNMQNENKYVGSFVAGAFAIVAGVLCCFGAYSLTALCGQGRSHDQLQNHREIRE